MCTWSPPISLICPPRPRRLSPLSGNEPDGPQSRRGQGAELVNGLQALIQQVSDLQADNERLREDNQRLRAQIGQLRAVMRQAGQEITRQAGELAAGAED